MRQYNRTLEKRIEKNEEIENNNIDLQIKNYTKQCIDLFRNEFKFDILSFRCIANKNDQDENIIKGIWGFLERTPQYNINYNNKKNKKELWEQFNKSIWWVSKEDKSHNNHNDSRLLHRGLQYFNNHSDYYIFSRKSQYKHLFVTPSKKYHVTYTRVYQHHHICTYQIFFNLKSISKLVDMNFNETLNKKNLFQLIEIDSETKTIAFSERAIKTYYLKKQMIINIKKQYDFNKKTINSIFNEITNFNKYSNVFININDYFNILNEIIPLYSEYYNEYDCIDGMKPEHITNSCWGILPLTVFSKLLKTVGKEKLVETYKYILFFLRNMNLGKQLLNTHSYNYGVHYAELLEEIVYNMHTEVRYRENLRIFLISKALWKVFSYQYNTAMTISSRYYKVLKKLDYYSLVKTLLDKENIINIVTNNHSRDDSRNFPVIIYGKNYWSNINRERGEYHCKFSLNKIVKGNMPLSTNLSKLDDSTNFYSRNFCWLTTFGVIPKNPLVKKMDESLIKALYETNTFKYVLRAMKKFNIEQEHDMIALVKISLIWRDNLPKLQLNQIHDFGINLPVVGELTSKNIIEFIKNNWSIDNASAILFAMNNEAMCIKNGVNLHKNTSMDKILAIYKAYCKENLSYKNSNIMNMELAQICAYNNVGENDFNRIQQRFTTGINNLSSELLLPNQKIFSDSGKYYMQRMSKTNPKGLFIGAYTSCCQYPSGAGDSCAWYSVESEMSSLYVIYNANADVIVGQSWFWVDLNSNTAVFDNIEIKHNININSSDIESMYQKVSIELRDTYRYKNVYIGTRYDDSDIVSKYEEFENTAIISKYNGYSDAREVISLI